MRVGSRCDAARECTGGRGGDGEERGRGSGGDETEIDVSTCHVIGWASVQSGRASPTVGVPRYNYRIPIPSLAKGNRNPLEVGFFHIFRPKQWHARDEGGRWRGWCWCWGTSSVPEGVLSVASFRLSPSRGPTRPLMA